MDEEKEPDRSCEDDFASQPSSSGASDTGSRRRPRPSEEALSEPSSSGAASNASLLENKDSDEDVEESEARVKRKCNRRSVEPSAVLDEPLESVDDSEGEPEVDIEDDEEGDEEEASQTSDDEDELPIHIRPRANRQPSAAKEPPVVLQKQESRPRYSLVQDLLRSQQFCLKPKEFARHRMSDVGLVQRFSLSHKLEGHTGCVNAIHFNENGSMLASGSDDLDVYVWDWQRGKKLFSFKSGHTSNVFQSKFLPLSGDTHIVTTSRDGQVRLAELSYAGSCRSTKKVAQHRGACHKIALLANKPHEFITGGEDGSIIGMDVRQPKSSKLLTQRDNDKLVPIYSVHASPAEEHLLVTSGSDRYMRLYDTRFASPSRPDPVTKFCPSHLRDVRCTITCAVFSNDGQRILGSFSEEDIYLFKTKESSEGQDYVKRYQGHCNSATVKGVNFYGPDCEFVVSGSDCGNIFFWDTEGEDIVHVVKGDENGVVNCLEPHPNLPMMATSGLDDEVKIWMPLAEEKAERSSIEKVVIENADSSARRSHGPGSIIGGQMIWHILRQFQRNERNRRRVRGEDVEESEENTSEDEDDMDDDVNDDEPIQCAPS